MQYINKNLNLSSSWDCGSSYSYNSNSNSSSGKTIWEGELITLTWVDVYLLNFIIDRAKGATSISGRGGLVDWP